MHPSQPEIPDLTTRAYSTPAAIAWYIACAVFWCSQVRADTPAPVGAVDAPAAERASEDAPAELRTARLRFRVIDQRIEIRSEPDGSMRPPITALQKIRALHFDQGALFVAGWTNGVYVYEVADGREPVLVTVFAEDQQVGSFVQSLRELQLRSPSGTSTSWYDVTRAREPRFLRRLILAGAEDKDTPPVGADERELVTLRLRDGRTFRGQLLAHMNEGRVGLRMSNGMRWILSAAELLPAASAGAESSSPGGPLDASAIPSGSGDKVDYQAQGSVFTISRVSPRGRETLASLRLPWASKSLVLLRDRAAFVPLEQGGIAVIDIGLSRYPYVAWRLARQHVVQAAQFEGGTLRLTTELGELRYDVQDPLHPFGPDVTPAQPLRIYYDDSQQRRVSDASWSEQSTRWPAAGRRVYLRGGYVLLGALLRMAVPSDQLHLDLGKQVAEISVREIQHIEPIELGEPQPPRTQPPLATSPSPSTSPSATLPLAATPAAAATRQPRYTWSHLAAPSGSRLVSDPIRSVGITLAITGGTVALVCGGGALVSNLAFPFVGRIGSDDSIQGFGIAAGLGLGVGIVGLVLALAAPDKVVPVQR